MKSAWTSSSSTSAGRPTPHAIYESAPGRPPAIHPVFICSAVVALALLLSGLLMPRQAIAEEKSDA